MCWAESWRWIIAKARFSSPAKTFDQLYMKCVLLSLFIIWLRVGIMCFTDTFKNPFQVSFLCLPLQKDSPEPLWFLFFFLTRALKVLHQVLVSFIALIHPLPASDSRKTLTRPRLWQKYIFKFSLLSSGHEEFHKRGICQMIVTGLIILFPGEFWRINIVSLGHWNIGNFGSLSGNFTVF